MRKLMLTVAAAAVLLTAPAYAESVKVLTRLSHLSGTQWVVVVSTINAEITSVTCDKWTMLGTGSWKQHNEFTIPAAPKGGASIAVMDASKFDGYCSAPGSIVGHTDDGDYTGHLDKGDGNWSASTKLTFSPKAE